eukprot:1648508-Pyramimonas_sp.AAC.1
MRCHSGTRNIKRRWARDCTAVRAPREHQWPDTGEGGKGGARRARTRPRSSAQAPSLLDPGRALKIWTGCPMGAPKARAHIDPERGQPWRTSEPISNMH